VSEVNTTQKSQLPEIIRSEKTGVFANGSDNCSGNRNAGYSPYTAGAEKVRRKTAAEGLSRILHRDDVPRVSE